MNERDLYNFLKKTIGGKKSPEFTKDEFYDILEKIKIEQIQDNFRPWDKVFPGVTKPIVGIVEVYKNGEFYERGNNLVVYNGREFAASKVFDLGNYVDWKITHFGIGKGGTSSDGITKIGPKDDDTDLYDPLTLNKNSPNYKRDGILKPINKTELIIDENTNHYTAVKNTLTIVASDEPDLELPAKVNEVALFYTKDDNWRIFSHYTTAVKTLEENDSITFEWYILF
jgi:hypothetical protein